MMRSCLMILLLFVSLCSVAQNKKSAKAAYEQASKVVDEAMVQLSLGEKKLADSLVRSSFLIYPTMNVYAYAEELFRMNDIPGGNRVINELFETVNRRTDDRILIPVNILGALSDMRKITVVFEHALKAAELNKGLGDLASYLRSVKVLLDLPVPFRNTMSMDMATSEFFEQRAGWWLDHQMQYLIYKDDKVEAEKVLRERPFTGLYGILKKKNYANWEFRYFLEQGEYEKALAVSGDLGKDFTDLALNKKLLVEGKIDQAQGYYQKLYKDYDPLSALGIVDYDYGVFELKRGAFQSALDKFQNSLIKRKRLNWFGFYVDPEIWKVYKNMGDAYVGLNELKKARNQYEISLSFHPDYRDAVIAMKSLDEHIALQEKTDQSPPELKITEPLTGSDRVVYAEDGSIVIKGYVKDISGVKEVLINGKAAYFQDNGLFWGRVPVNAGYSKIVVEAEDMKGHRGRKALDIEVTDNALKGIKGPAGKNIAILLAAQNYSDNNIPSLEDPISDAIKLRKILLADYDFTSSSVSNLFNPSLVDIKRELMVLSNSIKPEDNLIIFYAGHGIWDEKQKEGYWLLTDAVGSDQRSWLKNTDLLKLISNLPARNILLITDACFSGSVFKSRGTEGTEGSILPNRNVTRVAITSGNDTPVPDKSVFMRHFVRALKENRQKKITAQKIFVNHVIDAVMTESRTEPRYGTLEMAGHLGGDFIFTKRE